MAPRMPSLLLPVLVLLAASVGSGELNVWFDRSMLETVFSRMLMLSLKNPLRPRCKPRGNPAQLQHMLTSARYPIVADGHLLSGLYFDSLSRGVTLAFDVNSFAVHWSAASRDGAPAQKVQYKFMELRSRNTSVLHHPSLSIPRQGFVPITDSGFQMNLQCSSRVSGVTVFDVHAVFQWPNHPERRAIVMQHQFQKACLSTADLQELQHKCHCRRKCELKFRSRFKRLRDSANRRGRRRRRPKQQRQQRQRQRQRPRQQQQQKKPRGGGGRRKKRRRERRKRLRQQRKRCQAACLQGCRARPRSCPGEAAAAAAADPAT